MRHKKTIDDFIARQNNTRGMGLARDVRAGQAKPVPSQAQKKRAMRERERIRYKAGWRNA